MRPCIGKYASCHGISAASRKFRPVVGHKISNSTIESLKKAYIKELHCKRQEGDTESINELPELKRGRPVLLGVEIDRQVQLYLQKVRQQEGVVSSRIAMAAARGILMSTDKQKLVEFGGYVNFNQHWAYSLLKRMNFVVRKATTAKSKYTINNFKEVKSQFLHDIVATVELEEIPAQLILNWDQTGIKIIPTSSWTMEKEGSKRIEVVGVDDKRLITAVFCGTLVGDFLPVQLIYKGKTDHCHPHYQFPLGWDITHSSNHWSTEATMIQYVQNIIIPYVRNVRDALNEDKAALVIMDNFKGQTTEKVIHALDAANIHTCFLPSNTMDLLQPMDLTVNKPVKAFLRHKFEEWYATNLISQLKESNLEDIQPIDLGLPVLKNCGARWLVEAAEYISNNPQIIVKGFIKAGITTALDGIREAVQMNLMVILEIVPMNLLILMTVILSV